MQKTEYCFNRDKFNLDIKTVQGDMKDLAVFAGNTFDLIFNPCSTIFVDNVLPVWKESFSVLKPISCNAQ